MPLVAPVRRTAARMAALIAATLALVVAATPVIIAPASAAPPGLLTARAAPGTDDEGGTPALRAQLDAASKGYLDAQNALETSATRQQQLGTELKRLESELAVHSGKVGEMAGVAYRTGRLGTISALLNSGTPEGFMDRAAALDAVAANEDRQLRRLLDTRDRSNRAKRALDAEVVEQRRQVAVMAKRKEQAERALTVAAREQARASSGGGSSSAGGGSSSGARSAPAASAKPAPRNSDGSWPRESCSVNDPTTSGCITPRTLHAMKQAKAAGFTRFVSCYRSGGSGEHPKGRACDFAAQKSGFGGVASGGDRTYGNNLAAYYVKNASRLGVLYVIWFKQIWLPSSGWKSYSGAGGDPSSDHTNHVHLSVY
jgi:peptidoglycan DL-endopeptidase CwlO